MVLPTTYRPASQLHPRQHLTRKLLSAPSPCLQDLSAHASRIGGELNSSSTPSSSSTSSGSSNELVTSGFSNGGLSPFPFPCCAIFDAFFQPHLSLLYPARKEACPSPSKQSAFWETYSCFGPWLLGTLLVWK
jgi:hypothetical protein